LSPDEGQLPPKTVSISEKSVTFIYNYYNVPKSSSPPTRMSPSMRKTIPKGDLGVQGGDEG